MNGGKTPFKKYNIVNLVNNGGIIIWKKELQKN